MRTKTSFLAAGLLLATAFSGLAIVRYVDVNSASPAPPYTNWASAASVIQVAVDAAAADALMRARLCPLRTLETTVLNLDQQTTSEQ